MDSCVGAPRGFVMTNAHPTGDFDVIVIGSGMGGMTTATALSRFGHKVLLLEQAETIGGLTHSFSRDDFSWDVGLHYCGTFGRDQFAGRILDWLSGGTAEFRSVGTVYDVLHFPDEFEVSVGRPADAYRMELKDKFPGHAAEIDAYFEALLSAEETAHMIGAERTMPELFRSAHFWWNKRKIERWCGRTTSEVLGDLVSDPKLAAVLTAQWPDFGGKPTEASFAIHATIMGHYLEGAAYPVGGASAIAKGLGPRDIGLQAGALPLRGLPRLRRRHHPARGDPREPLVPRILGHERRCLVGRRRRTDPGDVRLLRVAEGRRARSRSVDAIRRVHCGLHRLVGGCRVRE